jgi:tetratricopeptide (TPR) repeat protein
VVEITSAQFKYGCTYSTKEGHQLTPDRTNAQRLDELMAHFEALRTSGDQDAAMALLERASQPADDGSSSSGPVEAHAAIALARYCMEMGRYDAGLRAAGRAVDLSQRAPPPAASQAVLLQELLRDHAGQTLRTDRILAIADHLVESGSWGDAHLAHDTLARCAGDDIIRCRRHTAIAIGCAEAAGNYVLSSAALQRLAQQEVAHGDPKLALRNIEQALYRAQSVLLNGARLCEAHCLETAGDAHLALQERDQAIAQYKDAASRFTRLSCSSHASRVQAKLDALTAAQPLQP